MSLGFNLQLQGKKKEKTSEFVVSSASKPQEVQCSTPPSGWGKEPGSPEWVAFAQETVIME